jgi:uncharacterized membrane protein
MGRIFRSVIWISAGLALAVLIHITLLLSSPFFLQKESWYRWHKQLPTMRLMGLPAQHPFPDKTLSDPYMYHAVCRVLLEAPVLVNGETAPVFWLATLFDSQGNIIDTGASRDISTKPFSLLILPSQSTKEEDSLLYQKKLNLGNTRFVFETNETDALLMIRFFAPDETYVPAIQKSLESLRCTHSKSALAAILQEEPEQGMIPRAKQM